MTFATPLGLLALLSIPAIIAIHLFRRRFPRRSIAGLFLWQAGLQTPQGGGRIDRLPITPSLLLECLAALALSLILAGARLSSAGEIQHLVVLLDDSASMAARSGERESARDRAVRRVQEEIRQLGSGGRITLIRSGDRPVVLAGPAALAAEGESALERWQPAAPHHLLALGLRLARELAGREGRVMVVTDTTPPIRGEGDPDGVLWLAVGEPLANVGIIAAERSLAPAEGRGTIALTLGNYSSAAQTRRLTILAGEKPVTTTDVTAASGVSTVKLPIPAGLPALRVRLADDALLRDNEVMLVEPRPRLVGVENRLAEGRGREALTRALAVLSSVTSADAGHLQFIEGSALDSTAPAGVWRASFGTVPDRLRAAGAGQDFIGPFVLEKRHPLLLGVTLGGVVWSGAVPLIPARVRPLASAGDRPLVAELLGTGDTTTVVFNLDLNQTNLIRTPDWPILISNLVEHRRQYLPGPERWNYRIGEWVRIRLAQEPKEPLRVRTTGGERTLPSSRVVEVVAPTNTGLLQLFEGERALFDVGVNFLDESESDLRTRASGESGALARGNGQRAEGGPSSDPLFWMLLAVAAAAVLANWCLPGVERRLA